MLTFGTGQRPAGPRRHAGPAAAQGRRGAAGEEGAADLRRCGPQHGAAGGRGGADLRLRGYGQLGHGDTQDQLLPKVVEALRGKKVVQISAGADHSAVLLEGGEVLTFGCGANNRLGHGDTATSSCPRPSRRSGAPAWWRWPLLCRRQC